MNRLTEKISNEILVKNKNGNGSRSICYGCDGISNCTTRVCNFYRAMKKLAAYEDLEEQGLLIRLPCKVGDKVYTIFCDKVYEKTIDKIIINRFTTPQIWVETKLSFATSSLERWDIVIGKTVFLTQEEAEKALEVE